MRRLLVLNFFPAFTPPGSGGELRYYNLYHKLSRRFDVTLLSPTFPHHRHEVVQHSETFREARIPKEKIHTILHQRLDRERIGPEVSALVCSLSAKSPNSYHRAYLELYPQADVIVHESPYMLEYDLFFGMDKKPRIYNSYNVESLLVEQILEGRNAAKYKKYIRRLEERLLTQCDLCFAVSEDERKVFIEAFGACAEKIALAPNGINPQDYKKSKRVSHEGNQNQSALFFGSYHPPNIVAVDFILNVLADQCPNIDFLIAGNCSRDFETVRKPNVQLLGRVDEPTKEHLLNTANMAINPMFSGAGTNFKVLEYLSSGLPLVSTELGARGLDLAAGEHFICAERESFAEELLKLADNLELRESVARFGQQFVDGRYSWNSIAEEVYEKIESSLPGYKDVTQKTLFVLNDFRVDSPASGGEIRVNRIYKALSRSYRVILLCLNKRGLIIRNDITDSFIQLSLPKTREHLAKEKEINSRFWISANDIVTSLSISKNDLATAVTRMLYEVSDTVILSHPYMVGLLAGLDGKPLIYESLNCEYDLKKKTLEGHPDYASLIHAVKKCEIEAVEKSQFIISVSDHDHDNLRALSREVGRIYTVPNGVDVKAQGLEVEAIAKLKKKFQGHPIIVFIGSAHKPNIDSVAFIRDNLAPSLPECFFLIIGSVCDSFRGGVPANVLLCGMVEETSKEILLMLADLAVNPVNSGSGSNLKLAEYMANRIPTVTTSFGARGYFIENDKEAAICELSDFEKRIRALLKDKELRGSLGKRGFRYVKNELDWQILATRFDRLLKKEIFQPSQKSLLAITYRFTDPPRGGAEVHLLELLKQLDKSDRFNIDVATLDLLDISNRHHFSSCYTHTQEHVAVPDGLDNTHVFRFKTDSLPDEIVLRNAGELFSRWMNEFRDSSVRLHEHYRFPILMGGWNFPEHVGDGCEIWTSDEALIYVKGIHFITLKGYSLKRTKLMCIGGSEVLSEKVLHGSFKLRIRLNDTSILRLKIDKPMESKDDPRILGIRVTAIDYEKGDNAFELQLDYDYKNYLRTRFLDDYVNELIRTAESRPTKYDELFQQTRGPLSHELENWLEKHTEEYDLILGHSIPFATSVLAAKCAKKFDKPLLLIPEYHLDDEFYHWRSYYDAMRQADHLLTFPKAASGLFFDKIGGRSTYLPCGIHLNEEPTEADQEAFRNLYKSELPYVLVLGRKDRAKRYQTVIEAVKKINRAEHICDAVIIGRDEDGLPINPDEAIYLGGQPRNIVLAALRNALCLVTMSESESFGIVILEAWAQRRPVIVSDRCVAYTELVMEEINGLHANRHNLHRKIMFLLHNPRVAAEMGNNGYDRVRREFVWETIGREFSRLLLNTVDPQQQENVTIATGNRA